MPRISLPPPTARLELLPELSGNSAPLLKTAWGIRAGTNIQTSQALQCRTTLSGVGIEINSGAAEGIELVRKADSLLSSFVQNYDGIASAASNITDDLDLAIDALLPALDAAQVVDLVSSVVGAVPIVGAAVQAVVGVGKLIASLLKDDPKPPERRVDDPTFNAIDDVIYAEGFLRPRGGINEGNDLTYLFRPPFGPAVGVGDFRTEFTTELTKETGYRLVQSPGWFQATGEAAGGYVPGSGEDPSLPGQIHMGLVVSPDGRSVWDVGDLYPTARQQGATIWAQSMQPGPMIFSVDARDLEDRWQGYLASIYRFLNTNSNANKLSGAQRRACVDYLARKFGVRAWTEAGIRMSYPAVASRLMIDRQRQALIPGRIDCAYGQREDGAMQNPAFEALWRGARDNLMSNTPLIAKGVIEQKMVRDGSWGASLDFKLQQIRELPLPERVALISNVKPAKMPAPPRGLKAYGNLRAPESGTGQPTGWGVAVGLAVAAGLVGGAVAVARR